MNSVGMNLSFGNRVARPWPMSDAIPSSTTLFVRHHRLERRRARRLEGQHLVGEALPLVHVALVTRVARVHADDDVEALHLLPERVELRQRERLATLQVGTGATRMRKILAPRSWTYCSSFSALSTPAARLMIGVE